MEYIVVLITLILSAFFSGMEIAFVSSNKIYLEIEKKQNGITATILNKITEKPSKFIATMLVGNNIAMVVYGFFMGDILMHVFNHYFVPLPEFSSFLLQTNFYAHNFNNCRIFTQSFFSNLCQ